MHLCMVCLESVYCPLAELRARDDMLSHVKNKLQL